MNKNFLILILLLITCLKSHTHAHTYNDKRKIEKIAVLDANDRIQYYYTLARTYDSLNRLTCLEEAVDSPHIKKTLFFYNESGLIEKIIKPNETILNYQYDSLHRLQRLYSSDQTIDYQYIYDGHNRPIIFIDHIHALTLFRQYNALNEIIEETSYNGITIENKYDAYGRRIEMTLPNHSKILYQYEEALLTSIKRIHQNHSVLYEHTYYYDEQGRIIKNSLDHAGDLYFYYDDDNRLQTILSPWWSETIYREDISATHRISKTCIQDPLNLSESFYSYTKDGQLASEQGDFNHRYQYNNLFHRIINDEKEWRINHANQIMRAPDASYHYNENGNQIKKQIDRTHFIYEYDALERLTKVIKDNQIASEYIYDPFNRRSIEKLFKWNPIDSNWEHLKTDYFIYDGDKEIGKMDANGQIEELRVLGLNRGSETGAAIALEIQNNIYIPIHDHQGSVRCLINKETKEAEEFYRYSAFGEEWIFDSSGQRIPETIVGNPWRYAAKRYDPISQLIFFGRRYYDPSKGCWTTPDPLFTCDSPNTYAFVKNDPINNQDLYGLFSLYSGWEYLANASHVLYQSLKSQFNLKNKMEKFGEDLLGETMMLLMGYYSCAPHTGAYGNGNIDEKARITFINGILTTYDTLIANVKLISKTHGGSNVHYIFRPTEGWTNDIKNATTIKFAYQFGFRSAYCHALAKVWKNLIKEMGGPEGGGVIIHYAHSLGGSDTDRARDLLTPEESKMIRVITFGSVTLTRNYGFQNVTHYMSVNDGLRFLDPTGLIRNWLDPNSNIIWKEHPMAPATLPIDHLFAGPTYHAALIDLGKRFLEEFAPSNYAYK